MKETSHAWLCVDCGNLEIAGHDAFVSHLRLTHQITDLKGRKSLRSHMRGTGWSQGQYDWEIGGKRFFQCVTIGEMKKAPKPTGAGQMDLGV